jgi:pyruvate/2-oxoglutarate dehydrogenase complex dihydrolipoamide acyltransferase (E2) component
MEVDALPAPLPPAGVEPLEAEPASASKRPRVHEDGDEEGKPSCAFCHEGVDSDDPDDDDPLVPVAAGRSKPTFAHENCLYWCPELTQAEDLTWQNVGSALRRCHRLKCAGCGEGDAPLGCKRKACRKNWHYPCATAAADKGELLIFEDEYLVACPICHEVMERRERKKRMEADRKKAAKQHSKQAAAAGRAAAAPAAATQSAAAAAAAPSKAPSKKAAEKKAAPPSARGGCPETGGAGAAGPSRKAPSEMAQPAANAARAPAAPPSPPPPPPPPPCPEGFTLAETTAAEKAIADLFRQQRCEDLPLDEVRAATGLPSSKLETLLAFMDNENKLMCRKGQVYLI